MSKRKFNIEFGKLEEAMRDESNPIADRVLYCLYAFSKAVTEAPEMGITEAFTAEDVADYLGIPLSDVNTGLEALQVRGLIGATR